MDVLQLTGVKTHNLKNLNLSFPHNRLYVITGVSGSGKSSLAFDTLYAEGQRRYVESLSAYARQFLERMEKPDVEHSSGVRPSIAIEAKNVITNARSTVGTQTEINDYLRVLFARIGLTICPDCKQEVVSSRPDRVAQTLIERFPEKKIEIYFQASWSSKNKSYLKEILMEFERQGFTRFWVDGQTFDATQLIRTKKKISKLQVCVDALQILEKSKKRLLDSLELAFRYGKGEIQILIPGSETWQHFSEAFRCASCARFFKRPSPNLFSFNSPLGACPSCQGFGRVITIDWDLVVPDARKSLQEGAIDPWSKPGAAWEFKQLLAFCKKRKIPTTLPWSQMAQEHKKLLFFGEEGLSQEEFFCVKDYFEYLEKKTYKMHVRIFLAKYRNFIPCPECHETRLKPEALCVQIEGRTIHDFQLMSLRDLLHFFKSLKISPETFSRVEPVYLEILRRLEFLTEVGLGYLTLARLSRTLSGGEVQRIHLATSLGSALVDTLYVLDEPSIGLHERDNALLIRLLRKLRDLGNTVMVVEHDRTMMESADEILDLGPRGGEQGGQLIYQGAVSELKASKESLTGRYLSGLEKLERRSISRSGKDRWISIRGAAENNLKNIDIDIPLGKWTVLTGVSGSGKSTLLYNVLYHHFERFRGRPIQDLGKVKSVKGLEQIDEMVLIDQSPIGRSPRSNPATYIKAYDDVRTFFSRLPESKRRGFGPGHFSFNVDGGRCATCEGDGRVKVEMHFLADVFVPCEACQGKRFKSEILEVRFRGKNIDEVLNLTVDQVGELFVQEPRILKKLQLLQEVGLGYLKFGQSATTLSGGEAQRLKLASEISSSSAGQCLYLFDEPTTGLHYHDIRYLIEAFDRLLNRGHSILVIEHHLELIRLADHIIDLGPEGGSEGGRLVYAGPLAGILEVPGSYTGQCLKNHFDTFKGLE